MGFASTSKRRETPLEYMDERGENVLLTLYPTNESDDAYHCGADISMLSQFGGEEEVLFPPCTMFTVLNAPEPGSSTSRSDVWRRALERTKSGHFRMSKLGPPPKSESVAGKTKRFVEVELLPSFV